MTRRFAADTSVSTDKSIAEIRQTVRRYGATEFAHLEGEHGAAVTFTMRGRRILFRLTLPDPQDRAFTHTELGKLRSLTVAESAWEQACRSRWRALALVIKAKLEAVEVGIVVFEDEFLASTVPPGMSTTIGEAMREPMRLSHEQGEPTALLPFLKPEG